ncbi:MAG: hypothetical protein DRP29_03000 [Thermodesulfobacteriota bacterium]|nr:MAG: hypothetical protein DRP29_03000 [Thermodesulfobacteriota bacterium]
MNFSALLFQILIKLLAEMTPTLRDAFCQLLEELKKKAEETESPIDDLVVMFLAGLLMCGVEKKKK